MSRGSRLKNFFSGLRRHSNRWYYLPLVCLLAWIDVFVAFIPTEGMIVMTSVMRPKRWLPTGLAVTTASSLGALSMAYLANRFGIDFVTWVAGEGFQTGEWWVRTKDWIDQYGLWALWFISIGPIPQQPAILIGALAGLPILEIAATIWMGRGPKYVLFSYLATKGEVWIRQEFADHGGEQFGWMRDILLRLVHDPIEEGKNATPTLDQEKSPPQS